MLLFNDDIFNSVLWEQLQILKQAYLALNHFPDSDEANSYLGVQQETGEKGSLGLEFECER